MENTKDITFINVNTECFQTYPCQHHVETDNGKCLMNGIEIKNLQQKLYNNVDEHFKAYVKFKTCKDLVDYVNRNDKKEKE